MSAYWKMQVVLPTKNIGEKLQEWFNQSDSIMNGLKRCKINVFHWTVPGIFVFFRLLGLLSTLCDAGWQIATPEQLTSCEEQDCKHGGAMQCIFIVLHSPTICQTCFSHNSFNGTDPGI